MPVYRINQSFLANPTICCNPALRCCDGAEHGHFVQPQSLLEAIKASYFDEVHMRIWNLPEEWDAGKKKHRAQISPDNAWVTESVEVSTSPWVTWDCATDEECKRKYYDMISVERTDDLGGLVGEGAQYHCRHEMGNVTFTVTDWHPPHHFTSDEIAFGMPVHFAMQVVPKGSGSIIRILYGEPRVGDKDELESLFRGAARETLDRLADMLENRSRPQDTEQT